jgi:hypothetical protein
MISTNLLITLSFAILTLCPSDSFAGGKASVVPGLLYDSGSSKLTQQLVLKQNSGYRLLSSTYAPVGCGVVGKTLNTQKTYGPVGVSRYMSIQDDPKCHDFWGSDKWRHIGVWFGGTLGIYLFFKSVVKTSKLTSFVLSAAVMSVIGVAREISDSNSEKNCFSEQDLFANSLGILSAGIVIAIF